MAGIREHLDAGAGRAPTMRTAEVAAVVAAGWPEESGLFGPAGPEAAMLMWLAWPVWIFALACTLAAPPLGRLTRLGLA